MADPNYRVGAALEVMRSDGSWSKCHVVEIRVDGSFVVVMDANGLSKTVPKATAGQYLRPLVVNSPAPAVLSAPTNSIPTQQVSPLADTSTAIKPTHSMPTRSVPSETVARNPSHDSAGVARGSAPAQSGGEKDESSDESESGSDDEGEESESEEGDEERGDADVSPEAEDDDDDEGSAKKRRAKKAVLAQTQKRSLMIPVKAGLTERQVQNLREVFSLFEEGEEDGIAPADLRHEMLEVGLERDSPEIWKLMSHFTSEDPVDFRDFIHLVAEPLGDADSTAGASKFFTLLGPDAVSQGSVGIEDLKLIAEELSIKMSDDDLLDMLEKAGVGSDGRLALDDFYAALQEPE